jgi:Skp family chaperone for outer membrane proteins
MVFIFKKTVADVASEVPAPLQPLYVKDEATGAFVLPDETFAHVDPAGYQSALDKERAAAKSATKALEPWKVLGDDPAKIQQDLQHLKEELAKKDTTAGQFEKFKTEVGTLHQQELSARDQKILAMQASLETHLVEAEATRELAAAHGSAALLMPQIQRSAKVINENGKYVVRIVDSEGDPRINAATGTYMTLSELVSELKGHAEFGKAFDATGQQGSGMRPGPAGNPRQQVDVSKLSPVDKIARALSQPGAR